MTKKLLSNIPLKLMSVIIGIVVWLLVVNIDDPIVSDTIQGVTVTIKNEAYVESAGLMCLVEEDQDVISVTVKGKRSVVDNIKASNIKAVADLTQITNMRTTPVMVPISVSCPGISPANIKSDPLNMSISLDDKMTLEFLVTVSSGESTPGKGYEIGSLTASPEKIKITGPQSLIQKIDKVIATVNLDGKTEDAVLLADLKIIDKNQEELEPRQMGYLKFYNTDQSVSVAVDLWKVKNDIKIHAGYVGYPEDGYKVEKITLTPGSLTVAGTDEALQALADEGNTITIPDEYIDVSGRNEDFETKIDISELLPGDIKLTDGSNSTVIASVSILQQNSQEYSIPTLNIEPQNVEKGLNAVFETDSIQVRIKATSKELSQLKDTDIKASIECSGRKEGTYTIPVNIVLPDGYELVNDVSTVVKLVADAETQNADNE